MTPSPRPRSDGARAIVCDADLISARHIARGLTSSGYSVTTCATAAECQAAMAPALPDVVVVSILLPDLDGLALTRRLRTSWGDESRQPRIVVVSVLHAERRALEAGADAFVLKPVSMPDLLRACRPGDREAYGGAA